MDTEIVIWKRFRMKILTLARVHSTLSSHLHRMCAGRSWKTSWTTSLRSERRSAHSDLHPVQWWKFGRRKSSLHWRRGTDCRYLNFAKIQWKPFSAAFGELTLVCYRYIHWWIQLTHDTNREEYPNLFDVVCLGMFRVGWSPVECVLRFLPFLEATKLIAIRPWFTNSARIRTMVFATAWIARRVVILTCCKPWCVGCKALGLTD